MRTAASELTQAASEPTGYVFRSARGRGREVAENLLAQPDAYRMIRRPTIAAGSRTKIGNHTFRATGITEYLPNGGKLEIAQQVANHESARTIGPYDRRSVLSVIVCRLLAATTLMDKPFQPLPRSLQGSNSSVGRSRSVGRPARALCAALPPSGQLRAEQSARAQPLRHTYLVPVLMTLAGIGTVNCLRG